MGFFDVDGTNRDGRFENLKFGLGIARGIRSAALARGDKWHLDEAVVTINGKKHWLWRAVDQHGAVLDVLVQSRHDKHAANGSCESCSKSMDVHRAF